MGSHSIICARRGSRSRPNFCHGATCQVLRGMQYMAPSTHSSLSHMRCLHRNSRPSLRLAQQLRRQAQLPLLFLLCLFRCFVIPLPVLCDARCTRAFCTSQRHDLWSSDRTRLVFGRHILPLSLLDIHPSIPDKSDGISRLSHGARRNHTRVSPFAEIPQAGSPSTV